jgi:hypothetical protein
MYPVGSHEFSGLLDVRRPSHGRDGPGTARAGGKPEREGRRCENPECRQVLMITDPGWKLCGRCQYEARILTITALRPSLSVDLPRL